MDEAELAAVEVGERELVVPRAAGEEATQQLGAARLPAVPRVGVAAALVLHTAVAECREVARGHLDPRGVGEALLLERVGVGGGPAEVVVERPVLHHQDDEVVDLDVARPRQRVVAKASLGRLREQGGSREARGPGEPRGPGRALEELPPREVALHPAGSLPRRAWNVWRRAASARLGRVRADRFRYERPERMRAARAFLRAPLLRCNAPVFTALSIRDSRFRYSWSAVSASPFSTAVSSRRNHVLTCEVRRRFSRRSRSARSIRFSCEAMLAIYVPTPRPGSRRGGGQV